MPSVAAKFIHDAGWCGLGVVLQRAVFRRDLYENEQISNKLSKSQQSVESGQRFQEKANVPRQCEGAFATLRFKRREARRRPWPDRSRRNVPDRCSTEPANSRGARSQKPGDSMRVHKILPPRLRGRPKPIIRK